MVEPNEGRDREAVGGDRPRAWLSSLVVVLCALEK